MENANPRDNVQEFRLPEWETTARHRGEKHARSRPISNVRERVFIIFDRVMPGHRKYLGVSRKVACIAIALVIIILLALILGLAIGLSERSR